MDGDESGVHGVGDGVEGSMTSNWQDSSSLFGPDVSNLIIRYGPVVEWSCEHEREQREQRRRGDEVGELKVPPKHLEHKVGPW